jgi:hypothetical protein
MGGKRTLPNQSPRSTRSLMKIGLTWIAASLGAVAAPSAACLPTMPGQTESQRLGAAFDRSTEIVYGVVLKGARDGQKARFKVIHVYKGTLKPGSVIEAVPTHGFDPPPCVAMPYPPSAAKGEYGVVAFNIHYPALNFIDPSTLKLAFNEGWIRSAVR